jgi:hypothetical protein
MSKKKIASQDSAKHSAHSAKKAAPRPARRKKQVKRSEAMRGAGLDEHKYAKDFSELAARVNNRGKEKLQLDVLKEWSKQLDDPLPSKTAGLDAGVPVQFVSNVPGPVRGGADAGEAANQARAFEAQDQQAAPLRTNGDAVVLSGEVEKGAGS